MLITVRGRRTAALLVLAMAMALLAHVPAAFAQRGRGPALAVSPAAAASALTCAGDLRRSARPPVLLLHGTTSSSVANWSWNWVRALDARGWAHCQLDLPDHGNSDIQVAAEYVTRAIRTMHRRAGRRIDVVGHSQGGMIARWSLKYWPDTRRMVDDYVGLSASNHGTSVFGAQCRIARSCSAASWQQSSGSRFLTALNRGRETFPGISYTEISTRYDEIVTPSTSGYLAGPRSQVTNTSVQSLCPLEVVDHFGMAYSNAAWLIGLDALTHRGPARMARVPAATCGAPYMPGVEAATFLPDVAMALSVTAASTAAARNLGAEPALAAYARRR